MDEALEAVRMVRAEADRLRLACVSAAGVGAFLHVVYDQQIDETNPPYDAALLGILRGMK